ncbi:Histidine kinase-, DNA gyrase B-, and HSP90-like ATPase [Pedobacter westerhofensis]|uniref:histidine kinase n=1 Tax=Pedobacter westerhofensis TaxID=425512 RepID=A0A521FUI1_9SPHI|nr:HAMP domain-containing sensor histidine kinase [Pedobacter westerhofensis]SMO99823.1 Histidine kinase-, DNA gyrase B-, and HSP90-like ATPase [Pedobacter westerhofensis]
MNLIEFVDTSVPFNEAFDNLPKIQWNMNTSEALKVFGQQCVPQLPVYNKDKFLGIVTMVSLIENCEQTTIRLQENYQRLIHDVRHPLGNIKGLFGLMNFPDQQSESALFFEICKTSIDTALSILEDLMELEFKAEKPIERTCEDLSSFFRNCVDSLRGLCVVKNVKLDCTFTQLHFERLIDGVKLRRAVTNVIHNAIKYSFSDSTINIVTFVEDDEFIFKISDQGVGIPEKIQNDVFEKFTRAQRAGTAGESSTGIGLYFSKQCIEQHGGSIRFRSKEGVGTTLYIVLPKGA